MHPGHSALSLILVFAIHAAAFAGERTEHFDRDPSWDGHNNRTEKIEPRTMRQDFGHSATQHAGGSGAGEIGGFITPAAEAAYYAKKIPERSFADPLSASGTFACADGPYHVLVGFFNSGTLNEWRTPNSIALRLQGRGKYFYAYVEYTTSRWRAGGDTPGGFSLVRDEERPQRMRLKGFASGLTPHRWTLKYDPAGNNGTGSITATVDGETSICHLDAGHKADGAKFDRCGLLTVMKQADSGGEVWLDDFAVDGETESFASDPKWDAFQNRRTYTTTIIRPRFDFGYSATRYAGKDKGEMGGLVFRGDGRYLDKMAYYGDRLEELTLDKPLRASGKISLRRGVTDADVLFGFFHAEYSLKSGGSDAIGTPPDFAGVSIGGPSREGFMFSPAWRLHNTETGHAESGPHLLPDGAPHEWSIEYQPAKEGGTLTATLDGKSSSTKIPRERVAHFNRFGLISTHTDGNGQHLYFDDLSYTWTQADLPKHGLIRGPAGSVLSLAYSPDGRLLAGASRDKFIRLWNAADGQLVRQFEGHTADVYSVAFSRDGRTLLSGSGDRTLRCWDVETAKLLRTVSAHDDIVRAAIYSPDGRTVASTGVDATVRLWDAETWQLKATLKQHTMRVKSLAFTADGKFLASAGDDKLVCVWNVTDAALVKAWPAHDSSIETLAISPDGKLLASSSNDCRVRLWDTSTWQLLRTLEGHREEVDSVAFSADSRVLASGSKDRTLKLWNPATGALLQTIAAHDDRLESLAFSPSGQLASGGGGKDFTVKLWEGLVPVAAAPLAGKVIRDIEYAQADGKPLLLDLHLPPDGIAKQQPLIVYVHGGAWRAGSKDDMPLGKLVEQGFPVASVDYRLSTVARFPAQIYDIKAAIRFLRARAPEHGVDAARIVLAGSSAGGHLAALVGVTNGVKELEGALGAYTDRSSNVDAVISLYGASNLRSILSQSTPHGLSVRVPALQLLLGGQPDEVPELARLASPVAHLDPEDPPILLIHGDADPQMPFEQSRELQKACQAAHVTSRLEVIPGGKHGGKEFYDPERIALMAEFLRRRTN